MNNEHRIYSENGMKCMEIIFATPRLVVKVLDGHDAKTFFLEENELPFKILEENVQYVMENGNEM